MAFPKCDIPRRSSRRIAGKLKRFSRLGAPLLPVIMEQDAVRVHLRERSRKTGPSTANEDHDLYSKVERYMREVIKWNYEEL